MLGTKINVIIDIKARYYAYFIISENPINRGTNNIIAINHRRSFSANGDYI